VIDEPVEDTLVVPRSVRLPVDLIPPEGFDPARLETWPRVEGRLEWVGGRLRWMPPCGERQSRTVIDVAVALGAWMRSHPEFAVGSNEAGMHLGDDTRAADVGVWRRRPGPLRSGFSLEPPVLAVEVTGKDETLAALREKADWYLAAGVPVVWIALPVEREVVVVTAAGETRHGLGERLPRHPALPDLEPEVAELFRQVSIA
jgi:Uma2 family endonuclease